jgi:glucose-1-phosphate adenylyltransferase
VLGIILGGGAGTRLYPLTKKRAKPAVPLGANYRLIDIPVSNCLNSNISKIYVLTQFNSASLNRHLSRAYASNLGGYKNEGFVEVLAAQQSPENPNWFQVKHCLTMFSIIRPSSSIFTRPKDVVFEILMWSLQGTADAVRQYLWLFEEHNVLEYLVLAGDHLYRMDYEKFIQAHRETDADITVAALPMDEKRATAFGLMKIDEEGRIIEFAEKPKGDQLKAMKVSPYFMPNVLLFMQFLHKNLLYFFSIIRLILPFWVLTMKEQRKCLLLLAWVYMLSAKMRC